MRNRFFRWDYEAGGADEIDPHALRTAGPVSDARYFAGVLAEIDRMLPDRDMRFLLTWNVDAFDERFRDAVVLLIGDEQYQRPSWSAQVRAIFKTGGTSRNPLRATLSLPPSIAGRVALRDLRNASRSVVRRSRRSSSDATYNAPLFELPLGVHNLVDTPSVPFAQRSVDVFFAGSIGDRSRLSARPRVAARRQMATALMQMQRPTPDLNIDCVTFGEFGAAADALGPETYSARLMDAKIALCPRGNFDETFRLFEAARCGCVAITEPLPRRWYYAASPAVQIRAWSELPATVRSLMADEESLARRARDMREWWRTVVAEQPVARYICARLHEHPA